MRPTVLASLAALAACTGASAQQNAALQPACATVVAPWKAPRMLTSAREAADAAQVAFAPGEAVHFTLHPDGEVAYATLPQGEGEAASFGGMASFTVAEKGLYRVGLSEPIWVDVAQNGKPAEAKHFGPGPACSGIRKAVSFALEPGSHVLEVSGSTIAEVGVIVEKLP